MAGDSARSAPPAELEEVLHRTREVVRAVVAPQAEATDRAARWPEESIRALQEAGLGGLVAPATSGGLGYGLVAVAQVCETLGRECASTALCFGMHCVGTAVIAAKATPHHEQHYLEPIAAGQHITTLALSEPGSGAHFYLPETRFAERSAETYAVSGAKTFVTSGGFADSYVMSTAPARPDAPPAHFSCVVVRGDADGLVWGPPWEGLGMRGNSSRSVELRDVVVPREDLLGEEGDELWYVFNVIAPYFLIAMAGTYLGVASSALELARAHLAKRTYTTSGASLADQPVVQHRLGTLWGAVERTRRLIYSAAVAADAGDPSAPAALFAAKAEVAECVVEVVNEAMTLTGGIAYRESSMLARHLRDARASHVMAPTTDLLRIWTGRALLDLPILSE